MPQTKNDVILKETLEAFLDQVASEILLVSQQNLARNGSVDTGQLFNSGQIEKVDYGDVMERRISYTAPQSEWIEYGTQPHTVSEDGRQKIALWAKRKLGLNDEEAVRFSWAYSTTVKEKGMEARPFLRPAFDEVLSKAGFI